MTRGYDGFFKSAKKASQLGKSQISNSTPLSKKNEEVLRELFTQKIDSSTAGSKRGDESTAKARGTKSKPSKKLNLRSKRMKSRKHLIGTKSICVMLLSAAVAGYGVLFPDELTRLFSGINVSVGGSKLCGRPGK